MRPFSTASALKLRGTVRGDARLEEQKKTAMRVEPKFRAELLGVANNLLAITLQAISKKADIKAKKDANLARSKRQTLQIGNSENTNIIVADRNELLKARKVKKED